MPNLLKRLNPFRTSPFQKHLKTCAKCQAGGASPSLFGDSCTVGFRLLLQDLKGGR